MSRAETSRPDSRSFARHLVDEIVDSWWIYVVAPIALTIFNLGAMDGLEDAAIGFVVSASATLCIGIPTQSLFVWGERRGFVLPLGLHFAIYVIVGVLVGTELTLFSISLWAESYSPAMRRGMWLVGGTVAAVVATLGVTYDRLRLRARETEMREERARRQAIQAQLEALRARMDPHFLFNSLNTVAALIEEDTQAAVTAVEQLSEILRYSVERGQARTVPLSEELDCARRYLALEAARYGDRLRTAIRCAPGLEAWEVPPLSLQPLVENAVKHGVARSREPVTVEIEIEATEAELRLCVRDDAKGEASGSMATRDGMGTAHATLRERLSLMYGAPARLELRPGPDGGYEARVMLPAEARTEGTFSNA